MCVILFLCRTTANRPTHDPNLLVNKSSLPLGTAIVSPSRQPYSSLRNRIYYNTNPKRTGSSNSRSNGSRNADNRSSSGSKSQSDSVGSFGKDSGSSQSQKKAVGDHESGIESRHSARLLRQKCGNTTENGNSVKRKAETELVSSKPAKSRSNVQASSTLLDTQISKRDDFKNQKKTTVSKSSSGKVETDTSEPNNTMACLENAEKTECDVIEEDSSLKIDVDSECNGPYSVKQNLFPPDHTSNESNVFSNDNVDNQSNLSKKEDNNFEENDTVTAFFGSLGLGRKASSDKDDASVLTESGASSSSSDNIFPQQDHTDDNGVDFYNKHELDLNNDGTAEKETLTNKLTPLTPTKKSARISAKRAILEKNIDSFNDETTIWSIWGRLPSQNKTKSKLSLSDDGIQMNSQEENVNMSPDSMSSTELSLAQEMNEPQVSSYNKVKGPRIKQTPVRIKNLATPAVQPEKQVSVGNVVWGKVHGHPWWPGRVLAVSGNIGEGDDIIQHAHVTWFGSNTSSIMPVNELQHFLANFKRRYKKAKKGCYRKAVKQAQEMLQIMGEI